MTSQGAAYPRPLLTSARPAGESANCTVLPLAVPEFSTLVSTAAAARALLDAAQQDHSGTGGCVILRTESLFRGFYSNRWAGIWCGQQCYWEDGASGWFMSAPPHLPTQHTATLSPSAAPLASKPSLLPV